MTTSNRPSGVRPFALTLLFFVAGCDCGGSTMRARPEIEVAPGSVDFGSVPLTTSLSKKVTITSRGSVTLTLERVTIQGDDAFIASQPLSSLSPSTTTDVEVTFRPTTFGPKAARLIITSNAVNAPEVLVPLVGDSLPASTAGGSAGGDMGGGAAAGGPAGGSSGGSAGGVAGGSAGGSAGGVAGGSAGGSGCVSPSDAAFCSAAQKNCGVFTGVDSCGLTRTASCGACANPETCGGAGAPNVCGCVDPDSAVCTRLQKTCGQLNATDACGVLRAVTCGVCNTPDTCGGGGTPNVCGCVESDAAFCARLGKDCDSVTGLDACGRSRTTTCGTCTLPATCGGAGTANVCGCVETPTQLCQRLGKNCGGLTTTDRCGVTRTLDCGTCPMNVACGMDNVCACTPETDLAFCARVGGCGSVTANDNCGVSRTTTCTTTCGSCGTPRILPALGNSVSGTTQQNHSLSSSCGGSNAPDEVWLWTPTASGSVTISTCGSSFDTIVTVRTGSCTGAEVGCNDNTSVWCSNGSTNHSYVTFNAVAGTPYYVIIDGAGSASGTYNLRVSPPDGTCSSPIDVPPAGGLIKAGVSGTSTNSGSCGGTGADKVHRWVAPRTGTASVTMVPDFWPSTLYVRSATCTGAQLACDNQNGQWPTNTVSFAATAGTTYWIWAGLGTYNGPVVSIYDLTVTPPP